MVGLAAPRAPAAVGAEPFLTDCAGLMAARPGGRARGSAWPQRDLPPALAAGPAAPKPDERSAGPPWTPSQARACALPARPCAASCLSSAPTRTEGRASGGASHPTWAFPPVCVSSFSAWDAFYRDDDWGCNARVGRRGAPVWRSSWREAARPGMAAAGRPRAQSRYVVCRVRSPCQGPPWDSVLPLPPRISARPPAINLPPLTLALLAVDGRDLSGPADRPAGARAAGHGVFRVHPGGLPQPTAGLSGRCSRRRSPTRCCTAGWAISC